MPSPRMTTRRWMLAVALAGLIPAFVDVRRRRDRYVALAQFHATMQRLSESGVAGYDSEETGGVTWSLRDPRKAAYHARLRRKYERASRLPWLPVPPDPPAPE